MRDSRTVETIRNIRTAEIETIAKNATTEKRLLTSRRGEQHEHAR